MQKFFGMHTARDKLRSQLRVEHLMLSVKPLQKLFEMFWPDNGAKLLLIPAPLNVEEKRFAEAFSRTYPPTLKGGNMAWYISNNF